MVRGGQRWGECDRHDADDRRHWDLYWIAVDPAMQDAHGRALYERLRPRARAGGRNASIETREEEMQHRALRRIGFRGEGLRDL